MVYNLSLFGQALINLSEEHSGVSVPFADTKIGPFFHLLILCIEGKNPKWNEWNGKVIFSGKSGIIFVSIPSPVR